MNYVYDSLVNLFAILNQIKHKRFCDNYVIFINSTIMFGFEVYGYTSASNVSKIQTV